MYSCGPWEARSLDAADWIVSLPLNRYLIMFLICLVYELGGSIIDDLAFMVLATPIFYPAVLKLGFDPIWFGMVVAVTVMIGVVIPLPWPSVSSLCKT